MALFASKFYCLGRLRPCAAQAKPQRGPTRGWPEPGARRGWGLGVPVRVGGTGPAAVLFPRAAAPRAATGMCQRKRVAQRPARPPAHYPRGPNFARPCGAPGGHAGCEMHGSDAARICVRRARAYMAISEPGDVGACTPSPHQQTKWGTRFIRTFTGLTILYVVRNGHLEGEALLGRCSSRSVLDLLLSGRHRGALHATHLLSVR